MHDTPKPSDRPGNPATPGPDRLLEPISGRILTYLRRRSVDPPHRLPGCKGMAKAIRRTLSPDDSIRPGPIGASALRRMGKTTRDGITSRTEARKNSHSEATLQPQGHVNAPRGSDLPDQGQKEQPRGSDPSGPRSRQRATRGPLDQRQSLPFETIDCPRRVASPEIGRFLWPRS